MPEAPIYMRTSDLYRMLRARYEPQAWALMFEVSDATGARGRRWADAIAMSLWPSRGLGLHGHEVKASRSDWLKELRQPEKAETICRFCDYWWLVVADKCIVHDGELPETWGLLAPDKRGVLKTIKEAPRLQPVAIDKFFLAALLRSAAKPAVALDEQRLREEYERGRKSEVESAERVRKRLEEAHVKLEGEVSAFEAAAGFSIRSRWRESPGRIGEIVKDVLAGKYDRDQDDLRHIRQLAAGIVARIDEANVLKAEEAA